MSDSIKILKLDWMTMKAYFKQLLLAFGFATLVVLPSSPAAINIVWFVMILYMLLYPFMVAEQYSLTRYYETLPVKKNSMVAAKYLAAIIYLIGVTVILIGVNLLMAKIVPSGGSIVVLLGVLSIGIVTYSVSVSVILPCCFWLGYGKAKIFSMILPMTIGLGVPLVIFIAKGLGGEVWVRTVFKNMEAFMNAHYTGLLGISFVVAGVCMAISYGISCRIYQKK